MAPAGPHGVDIHAFGYIDNELDVGIVVVVCTARDLSSSQSAILFFLLCYAQNYRNQERVSLPRRIGPPSGYNLRLL